MARLAAGAREETTCLAIGSREVMTCHEVGRRDCKRLRVTPTNRSTANVLAATSILSN
jgi:hypothetical protein